MPTTTTIAWLIAEGIFAVVFPILVLIIWRRKTHAKLLPAAAGAAVFVIFALGLETIPKIPLFLTENAVSAYIASHAWCYALVGALLAGVFEETGRLLAFSLMKKKYSDKQTAITYGIGHGGIECLILLGSVAVQMTVFAVMLRNGTFDTLASRLPDTPQAAAQLAQIKDTVLAATPFSVLLGMWERVCAVTFHTALSVLVFLSVHQKRRRWFFPLAVFLHAFLDIFAALYQTGNLSLAATELILTVITAITAYFSFFVLYRKAE